MTPAHCRNSHQNFGLPLQLTSLYIPIFLLLPLTLLLVTATNPPGPVSHQNIQPTETVGSKSHSHVPVNANTQAVIEQNSNQPPKHASVDVEQERVFIPLKEWKRRKLEEVESKVRTLENTRDASSKPARPPSMNNKVFRIHPVSKSLSLRLLLSRTPQPWCPTSKIGRAPQATLTVKETQLLDNINQIKEDEDFQFDPEEKARTTEDRKTINEEMLDSAMEETTQNASNLSQQPQQTDRRFHHMVSNDSESNEVIEETPSKRENTQTSSMNESIPSSQDNEERRFDSPTVQNAKLTKATTSPSIEQTIPKVDNTKSIKDESTSPPSAPNANNFDSGSKLQTNPSTETNIESPTILNNPIVTDEVDHKKNKGDSTENDSNAQAEVISEINTTSVSVNSGQEDAVIEKQHSKIKERPFNFASDDAGARVLATSKDTVGANNVLTNSLDKYLLSPCTGQDREGGRWVDLELSEDIILEWIETGNFEYYSSSARKIIILGAKTYPPSNWNILGHFDFLDKRTLQKFHIKRRVVTRYLRVIYAGKQGHERYCPISTIRAFGKNLITDWIDVFDSPRDKDTQTIRDTTRKVHAMHRASEPSGMGNSRSKQESETSDMLSGSISTSGNTNDKDQIGSGTYQNDQNNIPSISSSPTPTEDTRQIPSGSSKVETSDPIEQHGDDITDDRIENPSVGSSPVVSATTTSNSVSSSGKPQASHRIPYRRDVGPPPSELSEDDQIVVDAVRSDTLMPLSGEDNIFRRVTRMLRLLELNQTLTNQYIDSQLSNFAKMFQAIKARSDRIEDRMILAERQKAEMLTKFETTIAELKSSALKRDILISALLISVAFLLGTHWVIWTAVNSARIHGSNYDEPSLAPRVLSNSQQESQTDASITTNPRSSEPTILMDTNTQTKGMKRRKRKGKEKGTITEFSPTSKLTHESSRHHERRSVSSTDVSTFLETNNSKSSRSNAFDALSSSQV